MSFNVETTVPSATTTVTQEEKPNLIKSDRNSAKVEEDASSLEDDWDNDPANPRNWSIGKKWLATAIVNTIASYIWLLRLVSLL